MRREGNVGHRAEAARRSYAAVGDGFGQGRGEGGQASRQLLFV